MDESGLKIRIFIMRVVDWILLLAVFSTGVYAIVYAPKNGEYIALASVAALFLVNKLGSYTNTKIAAMKVNHEIEVRTTKRERRQS